jgi:hypothetical protein
VAREPSPLDGSARDLFAAARREVPRPELRAQTLAAMVAAQRSRPVRRRGALPSTLPWLLAAAAIALVVVWAQRAPQSIPIAAERFVPVPTAPSTAASDPVSTTVRPAPEPPRAQRAPAPRVSAPRPAPSLSAEVVSLDRARTALDGNDPKAALALLDAYERTGGRRMAAEATLLRVEALARAGKTREASALAQSFMAANPGSPLVDRARQFLEASSE